jgi:hypothetical protein
MDTATCFSVSEVGDALFTHGETQIARLSSKGEILWKFGFADILVSIGPTKSRTLLLIRIILKQSDFSSNRYQLDFDGKLLGPTRRIVQIRSV